MSRVRADSGKVSSTRRGGFTPDEREHYYPLIRRGILDGLSDRAIALGLGISSRTIARYRDARGIPDFYGRT